MAVRLSQGRLLSWTTLCFALALVFALRALALIDATGLWSDELYSVGKSFQPDLSALIAMLREDTHPPLYYVVLWLWGGLLGATPVTLRLFSWLAYVSGGTVMLAQTWALARDHGRDPWRCMPIGLLLAFCSPYPIRFAIEGKSYALLVLLVALAWWWRRREQHRLYGVVLALASLTHFYGLFLALAAGAWDGWNRRSSSATAAALASLPALAWIGYASNYLFSDRAGSWIGSPDFSTWPLQRPYRKRPFPSARGRAMGLGSCVRRGRRSTSLLRGQYKPTTDVCLVVRRMKLSAAPQIASWMAGVVHRSCR